MKINDKHYWHSLELEKIYQILLSEKSGLTTKTVKQRLLDFGANTLPKHKPPTVFQIFISQFLSPLIYILLIAGLLSVLMGDLKDAFFIFAVIIFNAILGTFQEWKAEKNATALQNLLKTMTTVIRDGEEIQIDAENLVLGDIVLLESGNKVPADLRLISQTKLSVDESLLTGESVPIQKQNIVLDSKTELADRTNMLFAGSTIFSGRCKAIVVATGSKTQIGQIAESVAGSKATKPPLIIRMEKFSAKISYIVLGACVLLGGIALARGMNYLDVFFISVALAVAAIPEGLPVAMTVALSIATSRMSKRNVIVRKLAAVESLGSCTCIASDKTGTLTLNRQTAKTLWLPNGHRFEITGDGYEGEGEIIPQNTKSPQKIPKNDLESLAFSIVIANEGSLEFKNKTWFHRGDTVDVALLALSYKIGLNPNKIYSEIKTLGEIPYESDIRFSAKFYKNKEHLKVSVKGALETILPHCETMQINGESKKINKKEIENTAFLLAKEGYRVIAVASGEIKSWSETEFKKRSPEESDLPTLTLQGLIGLIDPLRPEVRSSIDKCHSAGIKVIMITGDHPATALAIAKQLKIAQTESDIVTGAQLDSLEDNQSPAYIELVNKAKVFARVTPIQKRDIVSALMKHGHFVAVTGDGVNDSPALRKANIGVAMGSGTDLTKDTASIIITDDNFVSIVAGVEEGRQAYNNVRKVIYLLIAVGSAEIMLFTLSLIFGLPIPLLAVQLLWLNLAANGIQDIALAFEKGEPNVMEMPPRKPSENIFNSLMIQQTIISGGTMAIVAFIAWFFLLNSGYSEFVARNLLLFLMIFMANMHAFNARSETRSAFKVPISNNYILIFGIIGAQLLHILSTYLPFMQVTLSIQPISLLEYLALIPFASLVLVAIEIFKKIKFSSNSKLKT